MTSVIHTAHTIKIINAHIVQKYVLTLMYNISTKVVYIFARSTQF